MDIEGFALQVAGIHQLLYLATKSEIFQVSNEESKRLAVAIQNVLKNYNLNPSPTMVAWVQLCSIAAAVYGPKIFVVMAKKKMELALKKQQGASPIPQNITPVAKEKFAPSPQGTVNGHGASQAAADPFANVFADAPAVGTMKFQ